jgi:hypothetical protein
LNDNHPKTGTAGIYSETYGWLKALFVIEADFTFDPDKQLRGLPS